MAQVAVLVVAVLGVAVLVVQPGQAAEGVVARAAGPSTRVGRGRLPGREAAADGLGACRR